MTKLSEVGAWCNYCDDMTDHTSRNHPGEKTLPVRPEDGWVEAMRQQRRVEKVLLVAAEWDRDAEAYLNRVGQPLYGSVELLAKMVREALE